MNKNLSLLAVTLFAGAASLPVGAQSEPAEQPAIKLAPIKVESTEEKLGADIPSDEFSHIRIKNFQDDNLGRIKDLGVDLINGRIVAVLVMTDKALGDEQKVVAVPPFALVPDALNQVYRIDVTPEMFKTAPAIDLSKWEDAGWSVRIAAAYHHFGQETYFLEEGDTQSKTAQRPKIALGYVERANKLLNLPVANLNGEKFGKVWSLTMDITQGRIRSVVVLAPGNFKTKSVIPAMALSFNAKRDALVLDDTKLEYSEEPRFVFTDAAFGQKAYSREESYKGPHTTIALKQGISYRDIDQTVNINHRLRLANINARNVQVGTFNDRVTLRGWVDSEDDRRRVGEIAIAAARLELVDNQVAVGKSVTGN